MALDNGLQVVAQTVHGKVFVFLVLDMVPHVDLLVLSIHLLQDVVLLLEPRRLVLSDCFVSLENEQPPPLEVEDLEHLPVRPLSHLLDHTVPEPKVHPQLFALLQAVMALRLLHLEH